MRSCDPQERDDCYQQGKPGDEPRGQLNATDSLQAAFSDALNRHGPDARVPFVPCGRYTVLDV